MTPRKSGGSGPRKSPAIKVPIRDQTSAGGVVFRPYIRKKDGKPGFLVGLIERSQSGWWDLPKGHLEKGETEEQAAIREVEEESGLNAGGALGSFESVYRFFFLG